MVLDTIHVNSFDLASMTATPIPAPMRTKIAER